MTKYKSLWLLLALFCFLSNSISAKPCAPINANAMSARSDAVFSGEAIAQESREAELDMADNGKKSKILVTATEFKVDNFWKGGGEKRTFLIDYEYADETDARLRLKRKFQFKVNQNYLIYAYNFQNALQTASRCSGTKLLEFAAYDLKQLGKGKAPVKTVDRTLSEVLTEFVDKWDN